MYVGMYLEFSDSGLGMAVLVYRDKAMLIITRICDVFNSETRKRRTAWNYTAVYPGSSLQA